MDSFLPQLMLSIAIFAPGVILLAGLAFVGLLIAVEHLVARSRNSLVAHAALAPTTKEPALNPQAGPVVAELLRAAQQAAVSAEPTAEAAQPKTKKARNAH